MSTRTEATENASLLTQLARRPVGKDPLSDVLESLVLHSWIPGPFILGTPWGLRVSNHLGWFFMLTAGNMLIEVTNQEGPLTANAGDLIVVPQGHAHQLRDRSGSPATPIETLLKPEHFEQHQQLVHGGDGALTFITCGCFIFEDMERSPLHKTLPPLIQIKGRNEQPLHYVDHLLRLIAQEAASYNPCAPTVINRLVRILLIKTFQDCPPRLPEGNGNWLKALKDPYIGRALGLMHREPETPWTVGTLAERVAMSRSVFSARFSELVGKPPLEYLTEWRMRKACVFLRTSQAGLKEVADQIGYESAAAFSKAFIRRVGIAPGAYRRLRDTPLIARPSRTPPI
ncbi:MAG: AraC family transcriptional regulator [Phycisphaerales bacterium]|nr:AraC family transcriptional regulator [Phycisphaerales bacterium]